MNPTLKRLFNYVRPYKTRLIVSVILSILFSLFSALSVYLTIPLLKTLFVSGSSENDSGIAGNFFQKSLKWLEDLILSGGPARGLALICILILVSYILKNITGYLQSLNTQMVEKGVVRDLREEVYFKINSLSLRYFTSERSGNLISRMTNDVNAVQSGISASFLDLIRNPIMIAVFLALAVSISWKLTLISLAVFPLTAFVVLKIGASLKRRSMRMQMKAADLLSMITETIYGSKVIRAFGAEQYMNKLFAGESEEMYKLTMKNVKASELAQPVTEVLSIVAAVLIIWIGGNEILVSQSIQPEEFLGFLLIIFQLSSPIKKLSSVSNSFQTASASAERVFEILDHPVEVRQSAGAVDFADIRDGISLSNVAFEYEPGRRVLDGINLALKKSTATALVGPSGSGKSTLADLIARFYDVTSGEIRYDLTNVKDISFRSLRDITGMVQQETILFNDTIKNNIIFGRSGVSDEELVTACESANALEFILQTEKGFDTVIGERGLKLSGGQRQRISIARTLLRNPQILILDEATSALDTESEHIVQGAIDNLMKGRTSVVIAHRLSTIKNADLIVVLENGRIVQTGTHDELISKDGLYKKLYLI